MHKWINFSCGMMVWDFVTRWSWSLAGHEFWEPGVYVSPKFETAREYARAHDLFHDGNYYRCVLKAGHATDIERLHVLCSGAHDIFRTLHDVSIVEDFVISWNRFFGTRFCFYLIFQHVSMDFCSLLLVSCNPLCPGGLRSRSSQKRARERWRPGVLAPENHEHPVAVSITVY